MARVRAVIWTVAASLAVLMSLPQVTGRNLPPLTASPAPSTTTSTTLSTTNDITSTSRRSDFTSQDSPTSRHSILTSQESSTLRPSDLVSQQPSTSVSVIPHTAQPASNWRLGISIHASSVTQANSALTTANYLSRSRPASNGNLPSTLLRSLSVSSSTFAETLPVDGWTTELGKTSDSLLSARSLSDISASSTSSGNTISDEGLSPSATEQQQQPVTNRRPTALGSGRFSDTTFSSTGDSGHHLDDEPSKIKTAVPRNRTAVTREDRAQSVTDVVPMTTLQDTVSPDGHTTRYTVASTEQINRLLGSVKLVNREPNCERLNDGSYKLMVVAEVNTVQASGVIRNLTRVLSGMADFVSVGILNTTSTGWYAKVFYEVTVSVRRLVCKLWEVKEDLRLALESLSADISSNVQLHLGELESDIRTICANQHLCPDGFVCHVTSQLTCVSLCDAMKCGDHGHCAVDQTFQPVCICEEDGTFIQFGEDCDLRPDKATLTQNWRPAGIAGLTISGLFLLAIVVAASLYLWKRWNGRKVSQRVSPERPVTHPDSLGHNSAPENHLKLASGAV